MTISLEDLIPINKCVLVELAGKSSVVATIDGKYDTITSGTVVSTPTSEKFSYQGERIEYRLYSDLIGHQVWFDSYKDDCRVTIGDKDYAWVKYEDIRGYAAPKAN